MWFIDLLISNHFRFPQISTYIFSASVFQNTIQLTLLQPRKDVFVGQESQMSFCLSIILFYYKIVSFFHNINYSMLLQVMEFIPPTRISSTGSTHRKKSESFLRSAEWKQGKDGSTTERLLLYCLLYFQNNWPQNRQTVFPNQQILLNWFRLQWKCGLKPMTITKVDREV